MIGLLGTFDLENFGDLLFPAIAAMELTRRLPGARVVPLSPLGFLHPTPVPRDPVVPLPTYSSGGTASLAQAFDCLMIGGGDIVHRDDRALASFYDIDPGLLMRRAPSRYFVEGLGEELEARCPVAWNAVGVPSELAPADAARLRSVCAGRPYLSVRDEQSLRRVEAAGVTQPVAVVPDSVLLLSRLVGPDEVVQRFDGLRSRREYPAAGRPLVVQGHAGLLPWVGVVGHALARFAQTRDRLDVVILSTGPCHHDEEFGEALAKSLEGHPLVTVYQLPTTAPCEDLIAAIANSEGFVGSSLHGAITAFATARPFLLLDPEPYRLDKRAGFVDLIGRRDALITDLEELPARIGPGLVVPSDSEMLRACHRRIDVHFDQLAGVAQSAATSGARPRSPWTDAASAEGIGDLWPLAHAVGDSHFARVQSLREQIEATRRDAEQARHAEAVERARREHIEAELRATLETWTYRLSRPARVLRARITGRALMDPTDLAPTDAGDREH